MDIELLVVPDCPNESPARDLLTRALADVGLPDQDVLIRVVDNQRQAAELGFVGSPTVLINGADPFAEPGREAGLACRVYRSTDGALSGLPDRDELRHALKQASEER
ncbi:DsbA family protein [Streptomyces sp. NPDC003011]